VVTSKYDAYWAGQLAQIRAAIECAAGGLPAVIQVPGLRNAGERQSWYGAVEVRGRVAMPSSMAHARSLGHTIAASGLCARWPKSTFRFTIAAPGDTLTIGTASGRHPQPAAPAANPPARAAANRPAARGADAPELAAGMSQSRGHHDGRPSEAAADRFYLALGELAEILHGPRRLRDCHGPRLIAGYESRPATLVTRADGGKHGEEARHLSLLPGSRGAPPLTRRARRLAVHAPRDPARLRRFRRRPGRIIVVTSPGGFDQIVMAAEDPARTCAWPNLSRPTSPPHITRRRSRHPDPATARTEATQAKATAGLHEADRYAQIIALWRPDDCKRVRVPARAERRLQARLPTTERPRSVVTGGGEDQTGLPVAGARRRMRWRARLARTSLIAATAWLATHVRAAAA
jgi:hypothetical protein